MFEKEMVLSIIIFVRNMQIDSLQFHWISNLFMVSPEKTHIFVSYICHLPFPRIYLRNDYQKYMMHLRSKKYLEVRRYYSRFNLLLLLILMCHFCIMRWINLSPYRITEEVRKEPARPVRRGYHMLTLNTTLRRNLFLISLPYDAKRR